LKEGRADKWLKRKNLIQEMGQFSRPMRQRFSIDSGQQTVERQRQRRSDPSRGHARPDLSEPHLLPEGPSRECFIANGLFILNFLAY